MASRSRGSSGWVLCGLVLLIATLHAKGTAALNVKATWASEYDLTAQPCSAIVTAVKQAGFNTLYVSVWTQGRVFFPSATAANITGMQQTNYLGTCITAGQAAGIRVFAWFEYGVMSAARINGVVKSNGFHEYAKSKGWVDDNRLFLNHTWMDISKPDVGTFLATIMAEAAVMPGLAGVQVDDHVGCPLSPCTPALSKTLITTLRTKVKAANASMVFSYAPAIISFSKANLRSPYDQWLSLLDEVVVQVYRPTAAATIALMNQHTFLPKEKFVAGLRSSGKPPTPWDELKAMVQEVKKRNLKGFCVWDFKSITSNLPNWPAVLR